MAQNASPFRQEEDMSLIFTFGYPSVTLRAQTSSAFAPFTAIFTKFSSEKFPKSLESVLAAWWPKDDWSTTEYAHYSGDDWRDKNFESISWSFLILSIQPPTECTGVHRIWNYFIWTLLKYSTTATGSQKSWNWGY